MSGYKSNTMLTRILYLKMVFPIHQSYIFSYFIFKIFYVFFPWKLSSNKTPRNFIVLTLLISWLFIFNVGRWEGMLYFLPNLWNNENLVFPAFSDSLLAENHSLILINSSLTVLNNVFMLLCSKKKSVSPANIIGTSRFEELGRSFTYNKNSNGPSIEPCDTPHLISFFNGSADSVIFIYCFLPFK